ncbi:MAG: Rho termination factor [Jatrophihabitantaceae bacterium]
MPKKKSNRTSPRQLVDAAKSTPLYKLLRREGITKKKAIRIVGAATAPVRAAVGALPSPVKAPSAPVAPPSSPADLTKADLLARAREAGIAGRSRMTKDELIGALRRS